MKSLNNKCSINQSSKEKYLEIAYLILLFQYICLSIFIFSKMYYFITDHFIECLTLLKYVNFGTAIALIVIYILKKHNGVKEILLQTALVLLFSIVCYNNQRIWIYSNQSTFFVVIALFMVCATCTNFEKITKISLFTVLFCVLTNFVFSQTGLIEDVLEPRFGGTAHAFGFHHYSIPYYYMLFVWLAYIFLRKKELPWAEIVAEYMFSVFLYKLTTSRLALICSTISFLMYVVIVKLKAVKLTWKITKIFAAVGFPLMALGTNIVAIIYSDLINFGWFGKINGMLSGRLYMNYVAMQRYDIKLFGQTIIPYENGEFFFLDSGYMYELIGGGIIFYIFILAMYSFMNYYACKTNNKLLFIWITTIMIFTFVNDVWVSIAYTPIMLAFFIFLKDFKGKEEKIICHDAEKPKTEQDV